MKTTNSAKTRLETKVFDLHDAGTPGGRHIAYKAIDVAYAAGEISAADAGWLATFAGDMLCKFGPAEDV